MFLIALQFKGLSYRNMHGSLRKMEGSVGVRGILTERVPVYLLVTSVSLYIAMSLDNLPMVVSFHAGFVLLMLTPTRIKIKYSYLRHAYHMK